MYKLKSIARRGSLLGSAAALMVAAVAPAVPAFADALNPLTDRSLTLSSSAPGWDNTDGSGNATYAPPNSGANGQKTGNTFSFKVSTDTNTSTDKVKAITFQYCTTPAGGCLAPGDNGWTGTAGVDGARTDNGAGTITAHTSDLDIIVPGSTNTSQATLGTYVPSPGNGSVTSVPAPTTVGGNFLVYYRTSESGTPNDISDDTWAASTGWTMSSASNQTGTELNKTATGTNNQIKLVKSGGEGFDAGTLVKVVFFATNTNYITNPGSGAFFVRINMYKDDTTLTEANVIDGGVTVANVMNQSIQITTKVLETMDFSVGTVDPYTLAATGSAGSQLATANGKVKHGVCDPILGSMNQSDPITEKNRLMLGNELGEFSLETAHTYSTHSYWRLSSNSSAGATVYYSGVTLSNTVNDKISAIGASADVPKPGTEQFGLALANDTSGDRKVDYNVERKVAFGTQDVNGGMFENGDDNTANGILSGIGTGTTASTSSIDSSVEDAGISDLTSNGSWHVGGPQLAPLVPRAAYNDGAGVVNNNYNNTSDPISTHFAFDETSNTIPVAMADEPDQVVDCVTGKVRYIANIAATTPAGIYTTKVNYIASPQY